MVQKRERYIVGWTPRVNGYSPGKLSFSKYDLSIDASSSPTAPLSAETGNPIRGNSIPEEVSNRSLRSLNLSNDFLRVVSFHLLYCSLRDIFSPQSITKGHEGEGQNLTCMI